MSYVQVLMSTYNGEQYLIEQLESVLHQTYPVRLMVRDDGSSDRTVEILDAYQQTYENMEYYTGENKGVIGSFFDLMKHADDKAEYYALSDQDDYWKPEKLEKAVGKLKELEGSPAAMSQEGTRPLLYCGRPELVNQHLEPIQSEIKRPPYRPAFGNACIENICTGCTAVFNHSLLELVNKENPGFTVMHDWWLYLLASYLGIVYFDETPQICYRQHGDNEVGMNTSRLAELKMRLGRYKKNRGNITHQLGELKRITEKYASELQRKEEKELMEEVLSAKKKWGDRIKMVSDQRIYRQRKMDDLIFRMIFLTGSF